MANAVIVSAVRSPIGRAFKGSLANERGDELLLQMAQEALSRADGLDPGELDEVIAGCSLASGTEGGNLGRLIPIMLGRDDVPGYTLNRYCASSMQTTRSAVHAIQSGDGDSFLSLGLEMGSHMGERSPDPRPEERSRRFPQAVPGRTWEDPRTRGELPDAFINMGETAENVAQLRGVSREQMDEYAAESQQRVAAAAAEGFWEKDITPVRRADGSTLMHDDSPRPETTAESLASLAPVFREDGLITAGNCCPLNDGAAALVIMSEQRALKSGLKPLARILSTSVAALSPEIMGLGTIDAAQRALKAAGLEARDMDLLEINEAFAAQVIPTYQDLGVSRDRVNVMGGAIALGHPFGMSGARITTTLLNALEWRDGRYGLQTMCVAGGQGMAMVVERLT